MHFSNLILSVLVLAGVSVSVTLPATKVTSHDALPRGSVENLSSASAQSCEDGWCAVACFQEFGTLYYECSDGYGLFYSIHS